MSSLLIKVIAFILLVGMFIIGFSIFKSTFRLMPSTQELPNQVINQAQNLTDKTSAITQAQIIYQQKKTEGVDFSKGPCLSEEIVSDWSVDMAHNPRTPFDNDPQNQCQNFISGITHHFVEIDENGNILKTQ